MPMDPTSQHVFNTLNTGVRVSVTYDGATYKGTVLGKATTSSGTNTLEVNLDVAEGIEHKALLEHKIENIQVI